MSITVFKPILMERLWHPIHSKESLLNVSWKNFIHWADKQESNRLGWMAFSIIGHACIFTNITIGVILFTGNHFIYWPIAIGIMMTCLVANLVMLPTKITLPILLCSIIADLLIIITCISHGFDITGIYR